MRGKTPKIIQDSKSGYRRLEPVPEQEEIKQFYESQYYDLIRKGGRAPELRRLMNGGDEAEQEKTWLRSTLYSDICYVLNHYAPNRRVLDVGCGTGLFIKMVAGNVRYVVGVDSSKEMIKKTNSLKIENVDVILCDADYLPFRGKTFDTAVAFTLLQNIVDPSITINPVGIALTRSTVTAAVPDGSMTEVRS